MAEETKAELQERIAKLEELCKKNGVRTEPTLQDQIDELEAAAAERIDNARKEYKQSRDDIDKWYSAKCKEFAEALREDVDAARSEFFEKTGQEYGNPIPKPKEEMSIADLLESDMWVNIVNQNVAWYMNQPIGTSGAVKTVVIPRQHGKSEWAEWRERACRMEEGEKILRETLARIVLVVGREYEFVNYTQFAEWMKTCTKPVFNQGKNERRNKG